MMIRVDKLNDAAAEKKGKDADDDGHYNNVVTSSGGWRVVAEKHEKVVAGCELVKNGKRCAL